MSNQPQPTNDITALRETLFETLRGLSDKTNPMEIDRAKAINDVAQTLVNSVKVEVDALRIIGGSGTGFVPALPPGKPTRLIEKQPAETNVIKHRCQ